MVGLALLAVVLFIGLSLLCKVDGAVAFSLPELRGALKHNEAKLKALAIEEDGKTARSMSEDEGKAYDVLKAETEDIRRKVQAVEKAQALGAERKQYLADLSAELSRTDRQTPDGSASPLAGTQAAADRAVVTGMRDLSQDDPNRGYKTPTAFVFDVLKAEQTKVIPEKLKPLVVIATADGKIIGRATAGSDEQSVFANPYGGFAVPTSWSPGMKALPYTGDVMAQYVTNIPMTTPSVKMLYRVDKNHSSSVSGGFVVYRRAEADAVAASRMSMGSFTLETNPLMGIGYATEELLTDSPISFAAIIAAGFASEFASRLAYERLNGTGVGEFLGIVNSAALLGIDKETNQQAATLVPLNLLNIMARTWGYENAVWFANRTLIPALGTLVLDNGVTTSPMFLPSMREGLPSTVLGRPILFTEEMPAFGSAGDIGCFNMSQYIEGTYQEVEGVASIHVRFLQNERTFKFTKRNGAAPWWDSALTPKNGDSLSPFVRMNARA